MMVNRAKSGIIFHKNKKDRRNKRDEEIEGYPVVREYKYLGVIIDQTLS